MTRKTTSNGQKPYSPACAMQPCIGSYQNNSKNTMNTKQTPTSAQQKDAVLQASIQFIKALTGMQPPPIEVAPPEVFQPFHEFSERVCSIFEAGQTAHSASPVPMPSVQKITGTPVEIGSGIVCAVLIPMIADIVPSMSKLQLQQLYCGMLTALHSTMTADLGKPGAEDLMSLVIRATQSHEFPPSKKVH